MIHLLNNFDLSQALNLDGETKPQEKVTCPVCKGTGFDPEKTEQVYLVNFDFYTDRKLRCSCNQ